MRLSTGHYVLGYKRREEGGQSVLVVAVVGGRNTSHVQFRLREWN